MPRAPYFGPQPIVEVSRTMEGLLYHLTTIAVAAVFLVLCLGLWTMSRGTAPNLSQKLMRWRVGLQFAAIVIIMLFVLVTKQQAG
jgi:hypothetical protein